MHEDPLGLGPADPAAARIPKGATSFLLLRSTLTTDRAGAGTDLHADDVANGRPDPELAWVLLDRLHIAWSEYPSVQTARER